MTVSFVSCVLVEIPHWSPHYTRYSVGSSNDVTERYLLWSAAEWLASLFKRHLGLGSESSAEVEKVLEKPDFDSVVKFMKSDRCKNIITLAGAGISTCEL